MAGQLRYELIGDASRFEQAGRDVMNVSEQMEGSLSALEENIASLTQGQIRYNEEAERFRNASGDFVAGADAQARALTELNSEGVRTTEQIQNQITRLERLEEVYEGDARAATDLQQEQQRLQRQLAEVGMSAAQQNQDLTRLDQQFEQATVAMTDFANRQQRLQQELLATAAAQDRVQSSGVTMRSSVSASVNNLGFEFVQAAQDARYGAAGIANQIPLMTEQFDQITKKTGSWTASLYRLGGSFLGTVGVVGGITLALQWLPDLISGFGDAEQSASDFEEAVSSAADSIFELAEASREGLTTTRQFAATTVQQLEQVTSALENQINQLDRLAGGRAAMGVAPGTSLQAVEGGALQQSIEQLEEQEEINQAALDVLREQLQNRRTQARLLEVQRETIQANSTLTEEQASNLQEQSANLTTIVAAFQQEVISREQAATLAERRLDQAEKIRASQAVLNSLISNELLTVEQIEDARERLKETEEGAEEAERESDALSEVLSKREELRRELSMLRGPQGALLAIQEQKVRVLEQQIARQRALNRLIAEGVLTQQGRVPGGLGVQGAGPQQVTPDDIQASNLLRGGGITTDLTTVTLERLPEKFRDAAEAQGDTNQQIAQGISLASQLGATMAQAARQGQSEWNQLLGSVLATIGSVVALLPGGQIPGAAIAGTGQIVGSFAHGGVVDTPLQIVGEEGPELAMLPQGTRIRSTAETEHLMARPQPNNIQVQLETEIKRINRREFGVAIRENESRRQQYDY